MFCIRHPTKERTWWCLVCVHFTCCRSFGKLESYWFSSEQYISYNNISFSCPALQTEKSGLQLHWVWHPLGRKVTVLSLGFPFRLPFTVVWVQIDIWPGRIQHYLREWCRHNIHTLTRFNFTQFIEHLCSVCQIRMCRLYSLCHCISPGFEI